MEFICAMLLLISFKSFAQYPFEKYKPIKYTKIVFKDAGPQSDSTRMYRARYKNYKIELKGRYDPVNGSEQKLFLYYNNKLIKSCLSPIDHNILLVLDPLYVGDINGDGLLDFKIIAPNDGVGLAAQRFIKVFLFNEDNNHFKMISYNDFEYHSNNEFDFNNDGNYEILGQSYVSYKNHAYWVYDLYNYQKGSLVNVSAKYHYPIMIPFLSNEKEVYQITQRISRRKMKQFSLKLPEFYNGGK